MIETYRPYASWTGDPTRESKDYITLVDIVGTAGFSNPNNTTNSVTLSLGVAPSGETYTTDAMLFNPPGLMSIPLGPGTVDSNGVFTASGTSPDSAQGLAYLRNDKWVVFATRDTRTQFNPGNLNAGETCLYGLLGQGRVLCKADGSVSIVTTTNNTANGTNIQLTVSPNGLYFVSPFGKITLDAAGFRVSNSAGATFNLMGTSDPVTGSSIMMNAGSCTINSGMIQLGPPTNGAFGVAYGIIPVAAPFIPIMGEGVGAVVTQASASTTVFVGF